MRYMNKLLAAAGLLSAAATSAHAAEVEITVTNLLPTPSGGAEGPAITPVWFGFFDGQSFDAFDEGGTASPGTALIAELGVINSEDPAVQDIVAEFGAVRNEGAFGGVIGSPDGPPPIQPGESFSGTFNLETGSSGFLQFLSMLVPSNDFFFGNDEAIQVINEDGLVIEQTIALTTDNLFDAGTEEDDLTNGAAFVASVDGEANDAGISPADSDATGISRGASFGDIDDSLALTLPTGNRLDIAVLEGFLASGGSETLATIEIRAVDPAQAVPLPAAALLFPVGLFGFGLMRRRLGS